ncbi:MAG: DUF6876 family protein [Caulobacterales bacterium]
MSERPSLTQAQLDQFTGSETWWRHPLNRRTTFTDGVRFLAEQAGAYWLIDEILLIQPEAAKLGLPDWQFWRLNVHADKSATLACHDGDGVIAYAKEIGWTDFPLKRVELWFMNDVLYLPSEH